MVIDQMQRDFKFRIVPGSLLESPRARVAVSGDCHGPCSLHNHYTCIDINISSSKVTFCYSYKIRAGGVWSIAFMTMLQSNRLQGEAMQSCGCGFSRCNCPFPAWGAYI